MDPKNPLRGPRRAARRGEEALRYGRAGSQTPTAAAAPVPAATTTAATATATPTTTAATPVPHPADAEPGVQWRYNEDTEEIVAYEQRADGRWVVQQDPNTPGFFLGGPEEATWGSDDDDDVYNNADDGDDGNWEIQREGDDAAHGALDPMGWGIGVGGPVPTAAEWEAAMTRDPALREWNRRMEEELREERHREDRERRLEDPDWPYSGSDVDEVDEERERLEAEEEENDDESDGGAQQQQQRSNGAADQSRLANAPPYHAYLYGNSRREGHRYADDDDDDDDEEEEGADDGGRDGDEDDEMHGPEDDDDIDVDVNDDGEEVEVEEEEEEEDAAISFDPMLLGLKEINNLAHFSVSSHKPGNGVEELLHDDLAKYWQSDGPQPHLLTIHFLRRVEIRAIRFYVDYNQDESYTPTSVVLSAGTGHHDLLEFASLALKEPVGWQEIDLSGVGGGADGQSLCCWIVQVKVRDNHQNGKDTHIRGIKLYAIDENAPPADGALDELARIKTRTLQLQARMSREAVAADKDDYLFERLIAQSPDKLPGAPERSGSMAKFLRDEEIR
ncbi:hypothetical protein SCUCBS95973_005972 [Sporothrix curviconia]|uniref:DOC domain-containing protein n=1 Tax=Sporothrix curviconia TaxID=1260050 RepID=A0ABP0C198_9PEZI